MNGGKILVIGASGQIGIDLVVALRAKHGSAQVVASDIRPSEHPALQNGPFELLDVTDREACARVLQSHNIQTVYHLAAMLSARAEQHPLLAWDLNMKSLLNLLELAREGVFAKLFWPSSIAVFGPSTPRHLTPQNALCEPSTVYGISKLAGERWCEYYHEKYGVDVRSIRYPGLISHSAPPGGGTTDYAVEIFHEALNAGHYTSFLEADTALPMMYMEDAIRATIQVTEAPAEQIKLRSSYNMAGISFTPEEIAEAIRKHLPDLTVDYSPDFRQAIADSWPNSINDQAARRDWGWDPQFDLEEMVANMLAALKKKTLEVT